MLPGAQPAQASSSKTSCGTSSTPKVDGKRLGRRGHVSENESLHRLQITSPQGRGFRTSSQLQKAKVRKGKASRQEGLIENDQSQPGLVDMTSHQCIISRGDNQPMSNYPRDRGDSKLSCLRTQLFHAIWPFAAFYYYPLLLSHSAKACDKSDALVLSPRNATELPT